MMDEFNKTILGYCRAQNTESQYFTGIRQFEHCIRSKNESEYIRGFGFGFVSISARICFRGGIQAFMDDRELRTFDS
jgi:hypothetical protein